MARPQHADSANGPRSRHRHTRRVPRKRRRHPRGVARARRKQNTQPRDARRGQGCAPQERQQRPRKPLAHVDAAREQAQARQGHADVHYVSCILIEINCPRMSAGVKTTTSCLRQQHTATITTTPAAATKIHRKSGSPALCVRSVWS